MVVGADGEVRFGSRGGAKDAEGYWRGVAGSDLGAAIDSAVYRNGRFRPIADIRANWQKSDMKNVQIIDGATNATFSIFQATNEEFAAIFPEGRDMELIEDLIERLGDDEAGRVLTPLWNRPILKREAVGVHGTLFYNNENRSIPATKREVDWEESAINPAQRTLFSGRRE